jgi:hypothetical protein
MLIDAFPYAYGPAILLLRLRELDAVVDRHVIVECDTTYTGEHRELAWPELAVRPEFLPFAAKVWWHPITIPAGVDSPWRREEYVRSAALLHARLSVDASDDVILFGDHDEIPNPLALARVLDAGIKRSRLWGAYHEWFLNLRAKGSPRYLWEFRQPITFLAGDPITQGWEAGADLRALQWQGWDGVTELGKDDPPHRGWHMTLQGGVDDVLAKLRIGAHTELSTMTRAQLQGKIERRADILSRCALECCPNAELPTSLLTDQGRHDFGAMMLP